MSISSTGNWRNDPGLESYILYKKKFAITPITSHDGQRIWMRTYYAKYTIWSGYDQNPGSLSSNTSYRHTDFIENITEEEYIVRKISDVL
jgi:hypothetical protein